MNNYKGLLEIFSLKTKNCKN